MPDWLTVDPSQLIPVAVNALGMLIAAIVAIRINGLRSLSKMSSFDFVVTVALGSIVATVATTGATIIEGAFGFSALLASQWLVASLRRSTRFERVVDNEPIVLMKGQDLVQHNLDEARVTERDVYAKLREANVTDMRQVLAVVLETTGDISVLHGEGPLDHRLLEGVRPLDA